MGSTSRVPLAIFLLLSGFYLLTMSGHTYSPDEETMLAVTQSLLARGTVAVVVADDAPVAALRLGRDGGRYSPYGVLPSLLALPLNALGASLGGDDPAARAYTTRFAVSALNGPITAATAAILAAWAISLGAPLPWATMLALLYGLATFAWPYARTFFAEPLTALLLLAAAYAAQRTQRGFFPKTLLLSGLAAGLLLPTRIGAGSALPVLSFYVLWTGWQAARPQAGIRRAMFYAIRAACCWLGGLLPGIALLGWYNLARFGTPFASGYASEAGLFTTPLNEGLYGLLLSPGKSVLLFAPPLLLAFPGASALWRHGQRGVVLLSVGLFLSQLLLYAGWGEWPGGGVWGPRFLLPVVAPLLLLAAGLWLPKPNGPSRRTIGLGRLMVGVLGLAGFAGNLGGVLLNFGTYVVTPTPSDKIYSLDGSPLVGHWRLLGERWGRFVAPAPVCWLGEGLYATESLNGAPLPRRTGATGTFRCTTPGARLSFTLDDRRPPAAPASALRLLLNGQPLAVPPPGQLRTYRLFLAPGTVSLTLAARTWNPLAVGFSPRDDALGPQIGGLEGVTIAGVPVAVVDTAVAPLPVRARPRWAWYYDPPNQHFADHWAWYLPRAELAGWQAWVLAGLVLTIGGAAVAGGLRWLRGSRLR